MKTGKEIKCLHDIRKLVTFLCVTETSFTKESIFILANKYMEGSNLIVNKLLKTMIDQVVCFLIKQQIIVKNNNEYHQVAIKREITQQNTI